VIATLSSKAVENSIELTYNVNIDVPTLVIGDSFRIKQILLNLVNNAVRFTESGEVRIKIDLIEREGDELAVRFMVQDTGIGIPVDKQESLFKPFSQVDGSITRKYGGTGLGLVIAKSLVEAMLGEIHFSSVPKVGSKFWFDIPLKKQSKGRKMSFQMPVEIMDRHFIILDDSPKRSVLLASYLKEWGCRCIEQFNRQDFNYIRRHNENLLHRCDIVIVDGEMVDESGNALAAQLGTISKGWQPKILVLCKWGSEANWRKKQQNFIDGILTTPIRQQALVNRLSDMVNQGKSSNKKVRNITETNNIPTGTKILVVEDNKVNQKVVDRLLSRLGCEVTCVGDGEQAIAAVSSADYDLILMDFQMPIMDGLTATEKIRSLGTSASEIPIIGLTANVLKSEKEKAMRIGMNDYLSKPIVFEDLKKAVAAQLNAQVSVV
jgi:CheY-like chemotaxis protein